MMTLPWKGNSGQGVNRNRWLSEFPGQYVLDKNVKCPSNGVFGLKIGNRSDFYAFTFGYAGSKIGLFFFHYSNYSLIHHANTPVLQVKSAA
jgi:hypothetical protein